MPSALPDAQFFTGIDRAAEVHALCVPTAAGEITAEFTIAHSSGGIASPMRRLARYGDPGGLIVAIERSDGRLAGLLLERAPGGPGQANRVQGPARRRALCVPRISSTALTSRVARLAVRP